MSERGPEPAASSAAGVVALDALLPLPAHLVAATAVRLADPGGVASLRRISSVAASGF